jgi:membrane protein YdbS with pleckstrin-like domain
MKNSRLIEIAYVMLLAILSIITALAVSRGYTALLFLSVFITSMLITVFCMPSDKEVEHWNRSRRNDEDYWQ